MTAVDDHAPRSGSPGIVLRDMGYMTTRATATETAPRTTDHRSHTPCGQAPCDPSRMHPQCPGNASPEDSASSKKTGLRRGFSTSSAEHRLVSILLPGMRLQLVEIDELECRHMGCLQDDRRRKTSLQRLFPALSAQAPSVAGLESGKPKQQVGGGQVIAARGREAKELFRHFAAHNV